MTNRHERRAARAMSRDGDGNRYGIAFDTKEMPGKIVATTVALDKWIMSPEDTVNVALCNHPLYPALVAYVLANPAKVPD